MARRKNRKSRNKGPANPTGASKKRPEQRGRTHQIVFLNGKQKRVPLPPRIQGLTVEEFIARNADPIWLVQEGRWELLPAFDEKGAEQQARDLAPDEDWNEAGDEARHRRETESDEDEIPF